MSNFEKAGVAIIVILIIVVVVHLNFLGKKVNYNIFYKGVTQDEVCQMVKPEYLTDRGKEICK